MNFLSSIHPDKMLKVPSTKCTNQIAILCHIYNSIVAAQMHLLCRQPSPSPTPSPCRRNPFEFSPKVMEMFFFMLVERDLLQFRFSGIVYNNQKINNKMYQVFAGKLLLYSTRIRECNLVQVDFVNEILCNNPIFKPSYHSTIRPQPHWSIRFL